MSTDSFELVITVDSPLTAQRLEAAMAAEGIASLTRPRGAASTDAFGPTDPATWEVLVPADRLERARALATELVETIDREADANAKAAEDEALSAPSEG